MRTLFLLALLSLTPNAAHASPAYWEIGTSLGMVTSPTDYFKLSSGAGVSQTFIGSLAFFFPITNWHDVAHFEIGLSNRLLIGSADGTSVTRGSINPAIRFEFFRFFAGAGYSPLNYLSPPGGGLTSLRIYPNATSYYFEGGAIWKVIPELQITATASLERAWPQGGGTTTIMEYGLHFRFPFAPRESGGAGSVDFDGFRYPFGFMK